MLLTSLVDTSVDLTTVDTSYPILATGVYPWKIESAPVESGKKDPMAQMLVLGLTLKVDAKDVHGKPIPAGFKITHRIGLTASGKRTVEMISKDIARLQDAVFGHRIPIDQFDTDLLIDQTLTAKTKIRPAEGDYPEQAEIATFISKVREGAS